MVKLVYSRRTLPVHKNDMKTIVIVNSKGGVGKSNLTRHLAVAAEQENPDAVVLCDTDPQGSLADWWNARAAETPQLAIVSLKRVHQQATGPRGAISLPVL